MGNKKDGWGPGIGAAPGNPTSRISGNGFTPGELTLEVDGKAQVVTVDSDGRFAIEIETAGAGEHRVIARGPRGGVAVDHTITVV